MRPITPSEALAVVSPYFEEVRAAFVGYGFKRCEKARLETSRSIRNSPRHHAAARSDGLLVIVAPSIADLPEDQLVGIMAHEFGHVTDFIYPARFQLVSGELVDWPDASWDAAARKLPHDDRRSFARMKQWEDRGKDETERTADAVASMVFGKPIHYAGPCLLQSFERGTSPRPIGLT